MLTQCHPDWRHSRKGRGGGPPPVLSFCPMLLPSVYPAPPVVTLVKSPLLPQFSPAIQTDSSNTLKKKCAKLRLQGLPTADPSLGTSAPQECLLGWSQPAQGPGEKDPKQLHHSEITANNHQVFKEATKKNYQPHLRLHTPLSMLLLQKQELRQASQDITTPRRNRRPQGGKYTTIPKSAFIIKVNQSAHSPDLTSGG